MPIIAQQQFVINANDDLSISIIDKINSCGCVKSSQLSVELNTPLLELKNALRRIEGIKCDDDYEVCCTDTDTFNEFVHKLKGLQ